MEKYVKAWQVDFDGDLPSFVVDAIITKTIVKDEGFGYWTIITGQDTADIVREDDYVVLLAGSRLRGFREADFLRIFGEEE